MAQGMAEKELYNSRYDSKKAVLSTIWSKESCMIHGVARDMTHDITHYITQRKLYDSKKAVTLTLQN